MCGVELTFENGILDSLSIVEANFGNSS